MQSIVETDELNESLLVSKTDLVGKVPRQILALVDCRSSGTVLVDVSVDAGSNRPNLGGQVEDVLSGGLPVLRLLDTRCVGLGKLGIVAVKRYKRWRGSAAKHSKSLTSKQQ